MKSTNFFRTVLAMFCILLALGCATNKIKGTASDKSGTNGATNGTGKIAKGL